MVQMRSDVVGGRDAATATHPNKAIDARARTEEMDLALDRTLRERLLAVSHLAWAHIPLVSRSLRLLEVHQDGQRLRREEIVVDE